MSILASAAAALNVSNVSTPVVVADSAANVALYLDSLHGLAAAHKLTSITLTDTSVPSITITPAKLINDADALLLISNVNWTLALSGTVTAAQATGANEYFSAKIELGLCYF